MTLRMKCPHCSRIMELKAATPDKTVEKLLGIFGMSETSVVPKKVSCIHCKGCFKYRISGKKRG